MPEAYGKFVLKIDKDIEASLRQNGLFKSAVVSEILTSANIDPAPLIGKSSTRKMGNHLLDLDLREELYSEGGFEIKKGYVGVNIFGSDWMGFTHLLVKEGQNIELYANLTDEYGTHLKLGRNQQNKVYGLSFDEENPEEGHFQNDGSGSWKEFVPTQVQKFFKDLI